MGGGKIILPSRNRQYTEGNLTRLRLKIRDIVDAKWTTAQAHCDDRRWHDERTSRDAKNEGRTM